MRQTQVATDGARDGLPRDRETSRRRIEKVSEVIAREILNDILRQELKPGDSLASEAIMLTRYQIGRASMREAVRILEVHGVVRVRPGPGGGPVVAVSRADDFGRAASLHLQLHGATISDVIESRLVMEPIMARRAAARITKKEAGILLATFERGVAVQDDPGPAWSMASAEFHELIGDLSGNPALSLITSGLAAIQNARILPAFPVGRRAETLKAHERIAAAIAQRDGDAAEHLMRRHIEALERRVRQSVPGMLDEGIQWY